MFHRLFSVIVVATTGTKMSSTLQIMHHRKENVDILDRLHLWHVQSHKEFIRP